MHILSFRIWFLSLTLLVFLASEMMNCKLFKRAKIEIWVAISNIETSKGAT